jgi:excisionase family DNA binding protein
VPTKKHPPVPPEPRWATRVETAKYLHKSDRTVDNWIANGWITAYRMPGGRSLLIDLNEVDDAIRAGGPIVKVAS